jgi:hypothetical protein
VSISLDFLSNSSVSFFFLISVQVDDGKLSERTVSDELPQVCSASSLFIGND